MNEKLIKVTASTRLLIGAILGMVGSFLQSPSLHSLAWSLDGIGLTIAGGLLAVYYLRIGYDATAAGFLIFTIGEASMLSSGFSNIIDESKVELKIVCINHLKE